MPDKLVVEVAYALPEKQYLQRVTLEGGATVEGDSRFRLAGIAHGYRSGEK